MSKVQLDVSRAKGLYQWDVHGVGVAAGVTVQLLIPAVSQSSPSGSPAAASSPTAAGSNVGADGMVPLGEERTTKVVQGADPYFFSSLEYLDLPANSKFVFTVKDHSLNPPKVIGVGSLVLPLVASGKAEEEITLGPHPDEIGTAPDVPEVRGTLSVRHTAKVPKQKGPDLNADIVLDEIPSLDGSKMILPEPRNYVWYHLLEDPHWHHRFSQHLILAYAPETAKEKAVKDVGDVIQLRWKCKRSHQVFAKLRLTAERYHEGNPVGFAATEEVDLKREWKEKMYLREQVAKESQALKDSIDKMWFYFAIGNDNPTAFEDRARASHTKFSRANYEVLQAALLRHVEPSLSSAYAKDIAKEDYDADKLIPEMTHNSVLFGYQLRQFVHFWCDTLTVAEYELLVKALAPAILAARSKIFGAETTGKRRPSTASGKKKAAKSNGKAAAAGSEATPRQEHLGKPLAIDHLDELGRKK